MISEKEKEKEKERKEKEKTAKETEKVKHTRQMAVNHSLRPNRQTNKSQKLNNKQVIKTGLTNGGGQMAMPPQINSGAKMVAGPLIIMIGLPSHTRNVSYPGWNPGTPLTSAKILCT